MAALERYLNEAASAAAGGKHRARAQGGQAKAGPEDTVSGGTPKAGAAC